MEFVLKSSRSPHPWSSRSPHPLVKMLAASTLRKVRAK
jgi:hypothetical protein